VSGIALATGSGDPNGEPRLPTLEFGGGAMVGLACVGAGNAAAVGDASIRTPCLSNAASLPPCSSGGDSSSEENDALAGASSRGATNGETGNGAGAGACFGSARVGIGADVPPPPLWSFVSMLLGRRDPPLSFLMPVMLFTSRPNLPILD
tara:strand:- start:1677 stop:2126 length:450 start_codon:yes stop_codon:yes gene_type:complete